MKNLIFLSICLLAAGNSFAQRSDIGYRLGYSRLFSVKDKETSAKHAGYSGANTEVFYRHTGKGKLAFEGGLQFAHVEQPAPDYYSYISYNKKNNLSILVSAQYQLEKWSNGKQAFRTYFGAVAAVQGTQLLTLYPPGCFGTPETVKQYSAAFLAGVNQVFVYEHDKSLSVQSTVSVLGDMTTGNNLPGQLNIQLGLTYRIAP